MTGLIDAKTTTELGKGTGLGLSMVYGAVQAHRGQLELQSEPGRGSCFRVLLPVGDPGQRTALRSATSS